jgi:hypothetical protein
MLVTPFSQGQSIFSLMAQPSEEPSVSGSKKIRLISKGEVELKYENHPKCPNLPFDGILLASVSLMFSSI